MRARGPGRDARGKALLKYAAEQLDGSTKVLIVPACGHNDGYVYTTRAVLPVIFPPAPWAFAQTNSGAYVDFRSFARMFPAQSPGARVAPAIRAGM